MSQLHPPTLYETFPRDRWAALRGTVRTPFTEEDVHTLRGINDRLSLEEADNIYLSVCKLLAMHADSTSRLHREQTRFLKGDGVKVPFIIGIGGSVAVGKSTTARVIQAILSLASAKLRVALVTTDGFLYPNRVLTERGILNRKGFPESYDVRRLVKFLSDLKAGALRVSAPVYSHLSYDILEDEENILVQPDIVIVEGLNVLQTGQARSTGSARLFVSDFFDYTIYVDAAEDLIEKWYVDRFLILRETAFRRTESYFHRYADLSDEEAVATATRIWKEINLPNLHENIAPTKFRARMILEKGEDHFVRAIHLRR